MAELLDRSPIRFFDKMTNGGLKAGEIGLVTYYITQNAGFT